MMTSRTVSNMDIRPEEHLRQLLHVILKQDGGNPSRLLEILASIVEMEIWTRFGLTFTEFIQMPFDEGGVGWTLDDVEKIIQFQHRYEVEPNRSEQIAEQMAEMRKRVRTLLGDELKPLMPNGTNRHNSSPDNVRAKKDYGNSEAYTIARLKRDHPDLAAQVVNGKLTANKAALLAGIRKRKVQFYPDDLDATARVLKKHFTKEELEALRAMLEE